VGEAPEGGGEEPEGAPEGEAPEGGGEGPSKGGRAEKIRPFRKRSVKWLKEEARKRGFNGYSKKKKDELVSMLKGSKPPKPN